MHILYNARLQLVFLPIKKKDDAYRGSGNTKDFTHICMPMLIYVSNISPRLQFVLQLVVEQYYGLELVITNNEKEYLAHSAAKICYGKNLQQGIYIASAALLYESTVAKQEFLLSNYANTTVPFLTNEGDLPFDLFAAVFYLVTRYEEYVPHQQDEYGRYKASNSFAHQTNQLHLPLVDIWLVALQNTILAMYPKTQFVKHSYVATTTYDIDTAFAVKGRGIGKNIVLCIRDLLMCNFAKLRTRLAVTLHKEKDSFDTYDNILAINKGRNFKPIFFYLVGNSGKYNHNLPYFGNTMRSLAKRLMQAECFHGVHPSYETARNKRGIATEIARVEAMLATNITKTRQHYLKFYFPTTFNALNELGLTDDYSMGYAECPGFRASTCRPFNFYDVVNDQATNLRMHPVTFMEGSFAEDMKYTPTQALPEMLALLDIVKKYNGEFVMIWHNHTLSNEGMWQGWKAIHDELLKWL